MAPVPEFYIIPVFADFGWSQQEWAGLYFFHPAPAPAFIEHNLNYYKRKK
jgi:hypothetical protein